MELKKGMKIRCIKKDSGNFTYNKIYTVDFNDGTGNPNIIGDHYNSLYFHFHEGMMFYFPDWFEVIRPELNIKLI